MVWDQQEREQPSANTRPYYELYFWNDRSSAGHLVFSKFWPRMSGFCLTLRDCAASVYSSVDRASLPAGIREYQTLCVLLFWPCIATALQLPRPLQSALSKRHYRLLPTCTTVWDAQIGLSGKKSSFPSFPEHSFGSYLFRLPWAYFPKEMKISQEIFLLGS